MVRKPWHSQKGQAFEREICKELSLWFSGGEDSTLFWRSSQSGGRATTLKKSGVNLATQAGDIVAVDSRGEAFTKIFFVECKNVKSLRLDLLFYGGDYKCFVRQAWDKCVSQARDYRKVPILIAREYKKPPLVFLPDWAIHVGLWGDSGQQLLKNVVVANLVSCHFDFCFYQFSTLINHVDPTKFLSGGQADADNHYR